MESKDDFGKKNSEKLSVFFRNLIADSFVPKSCPAKELNCINTKDYSKQRLHALNASANLNSEFEQKN